MDKHKSWIAGLMLLLSSQTAMADWVLRHDGPRDPPPADLDEHPRVRHGYVWSRGHHEWRHNHYVWSRGRFVRERRGYEWSPGRWEQHDNHYDWYQGEWHPHR